MDKKSKKTKVTEASPSVVNSTVNKMPLTAEAALAGTEAGNICNEIKNKEIQMFALPGQKVSDYCKLVIVEPTKAYLLTTASSVLPSLEEALGKNYVVENVDKYTVVARAPHFPFTK